MTSIIHLAMSQINFLPNNFALILPWLSFNALSLQIVLDHYLSLLGAEFGAHQ